MELNHRPHAYQACALTELSYRPPAVLDCGLQYGLRPDFGSKVGRIAPPNQLRILDYDDLMYSKIHNRKSKTRMSLREDVREPHLISQN